MDDGKAVATDCTTCTSLLSRALDLTVRGRTLDAIQKRQDNLDASQEPDEWLESGGFDRYVARHNAKADPWNMIETRSLTVTMWAEEAFQKDLYEWETEVRKHLRGDHGFT